jgi:hypothetical protein
VQSGSQARVHGAGARSAVFDSFDKYLFYKGIDPGM